MSTNIIDIVRELVDALGRNAVADLTNALQREEVDRWLDGRQRPMTQETVQLQFAHSMLVEARQQGIRRKSFKDWFIASRTVKDTEHGYSISPCRALRQRMNDGVSQAFVLFTTGS